MKRGLILMMALATAMAEAQVEIRLNQVGYYPMEQKAVVVESTDPTGVITVEDSKGKTVLRPTAVREVKASPPPPLLGEGRMVIHFNVNPLLSSPC